MVVNNLPMLSTFQSEQNTRAQYLEYGQVTAKGGITWRISCIFLFDRRVDRVDQVRMNVAIRDETVEFYPGQLVQSRAT